MTKPRRKADTFKKIEPPPIARRKPPPKPSMPDAVDAMRAMIDAGRARQIAESLPDAALVSAGLADVAAQALQLFVVEKAKKAADLTAEEAQFLFDVHQGAMQGITKAHDVVANSPFIPLQLPRNADGARGAAPQVIDPPKETRLSGALAALRELKPPAQ